MQIKITLIKISEDKYYLLIEKVGKGFVETMCSREEAMAMINESIIKVEYGK